MDTIDRTLESSIVWLFVRVSQIVSNSLQFGWTSERDYVHVDAYHFIPYPTDFFFFSLFLESLEPFSSRIQFARKMEKQKNEQKNT